MRIMCDILIKVYNYLKMYILNTKAGALEIILF